MMNWLKIIATLSMLSFFSNAKAEGYCNDGLIAKEDANGVITFKGSKKFKESDLEEFLDWILEYCPDSEQEHENEIDETEEEEENIEENVKETEVPEIDSSTVESAEIPNRKASPGQAVGSTTVGSNETEAQRQPKLAPEVGGTPADCIEPEV